MEQISQERLRRGGSDAADPRLAAQELHDQIGGPGIGFALVFCSPSYDLAALAAALTEAFGPIPVYGCTTAGEITPFGYVTGAICGVGFPDDEFKVVAAVFETLSRVDISDLTEQARQLAARRSALQAAQPEPRSAAWKSFAFLMVDGLSRCEEQLVSAITNGLPDVPLVGGSAGDNLDFNATFVLCGGRLLTDAAILLVIMTSRRFKTFKTEHFVPTDEKMVVTSVDLDRRIVWKINAEPAAVEYARLVGLAGQPLTPHIFAAYPVVVRAGGQYHVRSIQKVNPDESLTFFCAIDEGLVLTVARGVDIVENLKELFARLTREIGPPDIIIGCDCVLRNLEVEQRQLTREVSRVMVENKVLGFCTYGEQLNAMHVNQTFTGVAIGSS